MEKAKRFPKLLVAALAALALSLLALTGCSGGGSSSEDKTITIAVKYRVRHPLYGKIMNRTTKIKAHDENNEAGIGDRVEIMETRKISKDVNWRLVKIIEKAK